MSTKAACYCFYHIQGEDGESASRPNAFRIPLEPGAKPTLKDIQEAFPLNGTGSFYFRFRVKAGDGFGYLDLPSSSAQIPLLGGNVHTKVLRMSTCSTKFHHSSNIWHNCADNLKCIAPRGVGLRLKASPSSSAQSPQAASAHVPSTQGRSSPLPNHSTPQMPSHSARSPLASGNALSPKSAGSAAGLAAAPVEETLVPPANVDEDLKHMSVAVQIKIMQRREAERQKHEAAVAAVAAAEASAAHHADELDGARQRHQAEVKSWGYDGAGEVRNIRALLSNLDKILWPSAKGSWKGVGMSALVDPKKVRIPYFKACRIVHPDKNESAPPDQQYIATEVFQALNKAWEKFEKAELNA